MIWAMPEFVWKLCSLPNSSPHFPCAGAGEQDGKICQPFMQYLHQGKFPLN